MKLFFLIKYRWLVDLNHSNGLLKNNGHMVSVNP